MKKNIKIERAVYAAWDYELELKHLNEMSEQGWQLIQGGCFHTKYEWDDSVVYRYQLDHNMKIENRLRYIDTYREQGWEYINSTFNGWHYFRKVYDAEKPAEEYEIYSDRPSKEEMAGRLSKLLAVLSVIVLVILGDAVSSLVRDMSMAMLGLVAEMLAALALTVTGCVRMRAVGKGEKPKRKFPVAALIIVAVLGLAWFTLIAAGAPHVWAEGDSGCAAVEYEMPFPDWIDIWVQSGEANGIEVSITGDNGYMHTFSAGTEAEGTGVSAIERNLFMKPGNYTVEVKCLPEDVPVTIEID